jgi:enoyl-CoA hydratase
VVLARPETRNAQDKAMLYELDRAFQMAAVDPEVKAIILAADGPHFSSGHDLGDKSTARDFTSVVQGAGHHEPGAAGMYSGEEEWCSSPARSSPPRSATLWGW